MANRKIICAGCGETFLEKATHFYRNKRCCGLESCVQRIDEKIKHRNYQKQRKKISKGTHRRGIDGMIKELILERDNNECVLCLKKDEHLQIHHILPVSNGGQDEIENLVSLCHSCHVNVHRKGVMEYEETLYSIARRINCHLS